jgi:lipid-binding SYLF domain-containing protein
MLSRPRLVSFLLLCLLPLATRPAAAATSADLADRARRAGEVFRELRAMPDRRVPDDLIARSRCIAVVPNVFRAAWVVGGRYGKGLLSCRSRSGEWSPPVHVKLAGGSFGLQVGASSTDVVLFFMTSNSVRSILTNRVSLGGEAGVAAGPVGRQTEAATDGTFRAQIYSYARSRGLFAGISLAGGYLGVDVDDTRAYYRESYSPASILFENKVTRMPKSAWSFLGALPRPRAARPPSPPPARASPAAAAPGGSTARAADGPAPRASRSVAVSFDAPSFRSGFSPSLISRRLWSFRLPHDPSWAAESLLIECVRDGEAYGRRVLGRCAPRVTGANVLLGHVAVGAPSETRRVFGGLFGPKVGRQEVHHHARATVRDALRRGQAEQFLDACREHGRAPGVVGEPDDKDMNGRREGQGSSGPRLLRTERVHLSSLAVLTASLPGIKMPDVRTTVTIEPDVERLLKEAVRRSGSSFKDVLNRAIREGLAGSSRTVMAKPFTVRAREMGLRAGIDAGALNRLADELEVEDFLERQGRKR